MGTESLLYTKKKVSFKEGDIIFKENDAECNEMYIIDSGRVKIEKKVGDTEATLTTLDEGGFFGEMSLITGNKRSASAIAFTDCKLHTMDKETFDEFIKPFFIIYSNYLIGDENNKYVLDKNRNIIE